jgi:DNA repair protein RadC
MEKEPSVTSPAAYPTKPAVLANACAVILGHNHPSGDPQPSTEDRTLTARLVEAGKILGIQVLDHIVVGDGTTDYFSFADNNLL